MPPLRRRAGAGAPLRLVTPYSRGWLSERRSRLCIEGCSLPDDALSAVFGRLVDAADVVRCAATCRCWGRIVAREAAVLSHCALPPVLPRLALGFFHQEDAGTTARKRKRSGASARPCFVPTASAARLLGFRRGRSTFFAALSLEHSRPVASRNGLLLLELRREARADGVRLCVCNPMTGEASLLPPLSGKDNPGFYACALLTGHDLDATARRPSSFRVLIVHNRPGFTALRSHSSDTGRWGAEGRRSGPKITTTRIHQLGQAVVLRGVAYWPHRYTAFAVRVNTPDGQPVEVSMPPFGNADLFPSNRLLGVTPDGKLSCVYMLSCVDTVGVGIRIFHTVAGDDDDDMSRGTWEKKEGGIRLTQLKVPCPFSIKMRSFCEKSGIVFFTLEEGSSSPGAFALNLATEEVEKVWDGGECHSWSNFCGYEMDGAAYLASIVR